MNSNLVLDANSCSAEFELRARKMWMDKLQIHARYFDTSHCGKLRGYEKAKFQQEARRILHDESELRCICELCELDYQITLNILTRALNHPEEITYQRGDRDACGKYEESS